MAREWGEIPAYRQSLRETLGEERGAEFIADVERRGGELHPGARRLFANWLDIAGRRPSLTVPFCPIPI